MTDSYPEPQAPSLEPSLPKPPVRIGVVSDTHGQREFAMRGVRMLESLEVQLVLHCGDIGSVEIPPLFAGWPTHYVLGNVDGREAPLREAVERAGGVLHGRFASLEIAGVKIALLHSDDEKLFRQTIASGAYALVCFGHTHKAELRREGGTTVLNPGALYRANPHTLAVVELPELLVTHVPV